MSAVRRSYLNVAVPLGTKTLTTECRFRLGRRSVRQEFRCGVRGLGAVQRAPASNWSVDRSNGASIERTGPEAGPFPVGLGYAYSRYGTRFARTAITFALGSVKSVTEKNSIRSLPVAAMPW